MCKPYLRVACDKLLAGSILVEGNHDLLINCIELYNRHPAIDSHYERFGSRYMISTILSFSNRYKNQLSIKAKNEDSSKKLIIGTNVFTGLVTSSVRLDTALEPEVGASTFLFNPSKATKVYISSASIEQANESITQQACFSNTFDYDSQLRQVRSRFTNPKTYLSSRFSSQWTDKLSCRPHTIFTLSDRNQVDADSDYMVASNILKEVADCMRSDGIWCFLHYMVVAYCIRFDKGLLQKSALSAITTNNKETKSKVVLKNMMNLYTDEEPLNIIGDAKVEKLLVDLSEVCTGQLKKANEGIKSMVMECLMEMDEE